MNHDTNDRDGPPTEQHTVQHRWEEPFEPSVTIVETVAAATDRAPTELPPLQNHVDPDALDALITRGKSAAVAVSFTYAGTAVVVKSSGCIEVRIDDGVQ